MMTLGDDYPNQQKRCMTILGYARELPKPSGFFLVAMLEDLLHRANRASMEQDLPAMIRIYQEMKDVKE